MRGCGYQNEYGMIWFSLLMRQGTTTQEVLERMLEYECMRTVARIGTFDNQRHYDLHESIRAVVSCRCSKYLWLRTGGRLIVNVILRLQSHVRLSDTEKDDFLRVISRRLFYVRESLLEKCRPWIESRRKTDFVFLRTGLLLENSMALKLALQTVSYEVSSTRVPPYLPFLQHPVLYLGACRANVVATVILRTSSSGSPVTQPVFTRSMLRAVADPATWPMASKGLCYLPAFRAATFQDVEEWVIHVHGTYCDHHPDSPCQGCTVKQPLSLQIIAQLSYLRNCMSKRRARVEGDRRSPYFH